MNHPEDLQGLDVIRLIGLGGVGRHGVLDEERRDGQTFLADVLMHVDTREAATSDDLTATVNYAVVARGVVDVLEGESVNLIETLAARIADVALAQPRVVEVEVTVHKPEAPVGVPFTDVQVTIRRGGFSHAGAADSRREAAGVPLMGDDVGPAGAPSVPVMAAAAPGAAVIPVAGVDEGVPAPEERPGADAGSDPLSAEPDVPVDVVLALGGNIGDVRATLRAAIGDMDELPEFTIRTVSPLARTAAVLQPDAVPQPDHLNTVVLATTTLSPLGLLEMVHALETKHGRQRQERWGERTLDVDIIMYDGVSSSDPKLSLPHPLANERAFVLVPWAQADPSAFLPGLGGGPVAVLAETAPDRSGVRWLALDWLDRTTAGARNEIAVLDEIAAPDVVAPPMVLAEPIGGPDPELLEIAGEADAEPVSAVPDDELHVPDDELQVPDEDDGGDAVEVESVDVPEPQPVEDVADLPVKPDAQPELEADADLAPETLLVSEPAVHAELEAAPDVEPERDLGLDSDLGRDTPAEVDDEQDDAHHGEPDPVGEPEVLTQSAPQIGYEPHEDDEDDEDDDPAAQPAPGRDPADEAEPEPQAQNESENDSENDLRVGDGPVSAAPAMGATHTGPAAGATPEPWRGPPSGTDTDTPAAQAPALTPRWQPLLRDLPSE